MRERSALRGLPKRLTLSLGLAFIAVLLHASAVRSEESSQAVAPTGDVWGSVEPLLEYRPLPTIPWLGVLPDGSIGDVWPRQARGGQAGRAIARASIWSRSHCRAAQSSRCHR